MEQIDYYRRIIHQVQKLDVVSLSYAISAKMKFIENNEIDKWSGYLPWRLLLLLKWGFEFGGTSWPLKIVDDRVLSKSMFLFSKFEETDKNSFLQESTEVGIQKYLRTISFQQFWLQARPNSWTIARQQILFCNLPTDDSIRKTIENNINGLKIEVFLQLLWLLLTWAMKSPNDYIFNRKVFFNNVDYSNEEIMAFLSSVSLTPKNVKNYLINRNKIITNHYLQLLEVTPFVKYPLLDLGDNQLIYSQRVLQQTIEDYFYDTMKQYGRSTEAERFSFVYEKYICRCISFISSNYYTEKELKSNLPDEKVTDFVVPFSDANLIIEVKATELRPIVKVNPTNESIQQELRDSVIKGTIQGFSIANSISNNKLVRANPNAINYLLIVTYKDLFLGDGEMVWREFLQDSVEPVITRLNISINLIKPERIFIISLAEFDQFISIVHSMETSASKILENAVVSNRDLKTIKWSFSQHLEQYINEKTYHPFLDETFDRLLSSIKEHFIIF